jgi:uncharacterized membrane protein YccC
MVLKRSYAIPLVVTIGVLTLFFFPEPQTNFLAYVATMLAFGVLIMLTVRWARE